LYEAASIATMLRKINPAFARWLNGGKSSVGLLPIAADWNSMETWRIAMAVKNRMMQATDKNHLSQSLSSRSSLANLGNWSVWRWSALAISLLLMQSMAMWAQTGGTGSIEGTVTDPSGSVVAGASVMAIEASTGVKTVSVTTRAGHYVLSLLQPGTYGVTVTAASFSSLTQENVVVAALANVAVDLKVSIGTATQSVIVTTEPPPLATEDLKLGSSINNETYDSLPLTMNGSARDPSAFIGLTVGVNSFSVQAAGPSTASFNGGQTYQNETYVEGLPMTSAGTESDTRNLAFGISVEAVEQFQVATTGSEATYEGQGVSNFMAVPLQHVLTLKEGGKLDSL